VWDYAPATKITQHITSTNIPSNVLWHIGPHTRRGYVHISTGSCPVDYSM